jgi:hypothetical protein
VIQADKNDVDYLLLPALRFQDSDTPILQLFGGKLYVI